MSESYPERRFAETHRCKTAGTFLTIPIGTLVPGVAGKVIKIHQYSVSTLGTLAYTLNDTKPTGGTVHFGGYISSAGNQGLSFVSTPYVPYPSYLGCTTTPGSALCLGTYLIPPVMGTVYLHILYTDYDAA